MRLKPLFLLVAIGIMSMTSCSRDKATLSGRMIGVENKTVYLDKLGGTGTVTVDSVATDDQGNFRMKINIPDRQPTIFNLRHDGDMIPLLIAPGEKIKISTLGSISRNYMVEGSEGSESLRELGDILNGGALKLDSLMTVLASTDEASRQPVAAEYGQEYISIKRRHLAFIYDNLNSIAAVYALSQRLPNDEVLFNGESDFVYYRMVADSVSQYYPDSPYVKSLQRQVEQVDAGSRLAEVLNEKLVISDLDYPDLNMPDMFGEMHKLSDLGGKVILLNFFTVTANDNALMNADFKELYSRWAGSGFEIYQVCVDQSRADWVTALQAQRLPWISVNDLRGASSAATVLYNVQSIPATYLISRDGQIVARNLFGDELAAKVAELVRQ